MRQTDRPAAVLQDEKAGHDPLRRPPHHHWPARSDGLLQLVGKNGGQTDDEENGRAQPQRRVENAKISQKCCHPAIVTGARFKFNPLMKMPLLPSAIRHPASVAWRASGKGSVQKTKKGFGKARPPWQ